MNIATLGTAAAMLLALPVAFLAARNTTFNRGTYLLARLLIVVSRSVDSLIWALIFIVIVGPGSLAGALAVGVRSLGFVAKLFAEGIEEIDRGQIEAVRATGAFRALRRRSAAHLNRRVGCDKGRRVRNRFYVSYPPELSARYKSQARYPIVDSGGMDSPIASVK